jgi:hypothetical protein
VSATTPTPTPTVDDYLACWRNQPFDALVDDARYRDWERAWTALVDDADAGVPNAAAAIAVVDAEVAATIALLRAEAPSCANASG